MIGTVTCDLNSTSSLSTTVVIVENHHTRSESLKNEQLSICLRYHIDSFRYLGYAVYKRKTTLLIKNLTFKWPWTMKKHSIIFWPFFRHLGKIALPFSTLRLIFSKRTFWKRTFWKRYYWKRYMYHEKIT